MKASTAQQQQMLRDGVALAEGRRKVMAQLIESDPKAAIAFTVPYSIRDQLPPAIKSLLEQRLSAVGDIVVLAATRMRSAKGRNTSIRRFVEVGSKAYQAFVYGDRRAQGTASGLSLHGVLQGDKLALSDSSLRVLEAGEKPEEDMLRSVARARAARERARVVDKAELRRLTHNAATVEDGTISRKQGVNFCKIVT